MKKANMKSIQSVLLLGLSLVFLTNCSSSEGTIKKEDECFDVNYHRVSCLKELINPKLFN